MGEGMVIRVTPTVTVEKFASYLAEKLSEVGMSLADEQMGQMSEYYSLLIEWNEKMNLTAVTEPQEAAVKHVLDSLMIAQVLHSEQMVGPAADVGTGAGLPGIPLRIAYPDLEISLIDSLRKRLSFLEAVIERLALKSVGVFHFRAEDAGRSQQHREKYPLVVARAVARLPVLLEYCLPLCKVGGLFVAYKGPGVAEEVEAGAKAAEALGGKLIEMKEYDLPEGMGQRSLVVYTKEASTPNKYPRKAGMPAKQPL